MSCRHESLTVDGKLSPPTSFTKVYNEECTLCFQKSTDPEGLHVCFSCFNGGCLEHAKLHFEKTGHPLSLHLKKIIESDKDNDLPNKLCRVEIQAEPKETFHYEKVINCFSCEQSVDDPTLQSLAEKIMQADSAKKKSDVQVWKETVIACEHTLGIQQDEFSPTAISKHTSKHCDNCDLKNNVWLCLICGTVGCGRKQFDGSGGNGHASDHFKETGHGISVKLGTITPEGEADIFCYHCDEMRSDPELAKHLSLFGMRVEGAERTEKSMAELQLEQNVKYDFSMTTQDGADLESAIGQGCVGLTNLGNSCYLASVMQTLCSLPQFINSFGDESHYMTCSKEPSACFQCQFTKMQLAFASGKHEKVSPWMFKAVVGSGHPEFSSTQQQDAAEFFSHLMRLVHRVNPSLSALKAFDHKIRQTLTCASCRNSRSQVMDSEVLPLDLGVAVLEAEDPLDPKVTLEDCIKRAFASEDVETRCDSCSHSVSIKTQSLTKLPEILVLPLSRYITENWVPRKLDLAITVPIKDLDLKNFYDPKLATEDTSNNEVRVTVSEEVIQQLMEMGFSKHKSIQALEQTGNQGAEAAMEWLFQNLESPEQEYAEVHPEDPTANLEIPEESINILVGAGYSVAQARKALAEAGLDVNMAYESLLTNPTSSSNHITFSRKLPVSASPATPDDGPTLYDLEAFICHKGPSIHCGHYVAYRKDTKGQWVLCNDEKLAWVTEEMVHEAASKAYIFFYKRKQTFN